jgi:hypothetical protein
MLLISTARGREEDRAVIAPRVKCVRISRRTRVSALSLCHHICIAYLRLPLPRYLLRNIDALCAAASRARSCSVRHLESSHPRLAVPALRCSDDYGLMTSHGRVLLLRRRGW